MTLGKVLVSSKLQFPQIEAIAISILQDIDIDKYSIQQSS